MKSGWISPVIADCINNVARASQLEEFVLQNRCVAGNRGSILFKNVATIGKMKSKILIIFFFVAASSIVCIKHLGISASVS